MPDEPVAVAAERRPYLRPADYYSTATPQAILPLWARYGCGALSLFILILVFVGGAIFSTGGGLTQFMDFAFGMTMGEVRGMYQPAVTDAQKKALEAEIETLREHLRTERISVASINPVLQTINRAIGDEKLQPAEVDAIIGAARKANASAKPAKP
jgi:hypothetical protein